VKNIIIIGGGPAGMMAAVAAKEKNPNCGVQLFEKNANLGAKVLISGGGRCNVTTGIFDVKELLKNYPRGAKFLMTAMFRFPPKKVMEWFEEHGVKLKTEEDLRVFPVSDNSKDVVNALEKNLKENGVEIICNMPVSKITRNGKQFKVESKDGNTFTADAVILTTGGNAYRHTGSTGDGYAFAEALGHKITKLGSSLSSFVVAEKWIGDLAGVSFEKAKLTLGKYERRGAFMFTHRGVSGPAVFALSSYAAYEPISAKTPLKLTVDFFPNEKLEALDKRLFDLIQKNSQKGLTNFLDILLPKSLCAVVVSLSSIDGKTKAGSLTKENRKALAHLLKEFTMTIIDRSGGEEFVTAGGVELSEINTNTMESKICPGLYFAGEIMDVDGFTGGFNLQASWATGALAGNSATN
jgi:hypothetical protein